MRQHGQTRPQGVAGGGACAVGAGVQKQVGAVVAGQVFFGRDAPGEHQALGGDALGLGVCGQVVAGLRVVLQHPQHAAGAALQDAHPARPHLGREFVVVVEGAKHEALCGQATFGAGGWRANGALAVIGLVAGQVDGLLGEVRPQFGRHQKAVGQDEVNPWDGAAAHVAQIAGLHRSRAVGHDAVA